MVPLCNADNLSCQKIINEVRVLSGASYAVFNQFDANGRDFTTVAVSGAPEHLERASKLLGFNLIGRTWPYDPRRKVIINNNTVTIFGNLRQLTDKTISPTLIQALEKMFQIGQVAVVKVMDKDQVMGDFTLIMPQGKALKNRESVVNLAAMSGELLGREQQP